MESRMTKISARGDKKIQLKVIPGHFATPQSHITHYLDLTTMRSRSSEALRVAEALAANYETSIPVDTDWRLSVHTWQRHLPELVYIL